MSTEAPAVKTKKHTFDPEYADIHPHTRWDVYVDGVYAGWCEARTDRRGGYYGDWHYAVAGQRSEWSDTKRSCVAAITAAWQAKQQAAV